MLYVDAVVPEAGAPSSEWTWARPSLCLWMSDEVYARDRPEDRRAWLSAALNGRAAVDALQSRWGLGGARSWYRDNSRETLRDETFAAWLRRGALRDRSDVPTTSSRPRWALAETFADLFDPSLTGGELLDAMASWRESRLTKGELVRIATLRARERATFAIDVVLPDGVVRSLEPGDASVILRGVVQEWAPSRLTDPVVLCISEPGDKVYLADAARLRALGLAMDPQNVLPDAVIVDIGQSEPQFWMVEAVASDGPVTQARRAELLRWAHGQGIPGTSCHFLSAFLDRNDPAARRRLKDLATGTFAWYVGEPDHELAWYEIRP
jgi:hypothetical protein